jgi:hypothetical protein
MSMAFANLGCKHNLHWLKKFGAKWARVSGDKCENMQQDKTTAPPTKTAETPRCVRSAKSTPLKNAPLSCGKTARDGKPVKLDRPAPKLADWDDDGVCAQ